MLLNFGVESSLEISLFYFNDELADWPIVTPASQQSKTKAIVRFLAQPIPTVFWKRWIL